MNFAKSKADGPMDPSLPNAAGLMIAFREPGPCLTPKEQSTSIHFTTDKS